MTTLPRLSAWRKLAYGSGDSAFSLVGTVLGLIYLDFLVNVVGLQPQLAGLALGVGRIWDAANDIFLGTLSDRTRSRWGRRRPYLLFGTLPFAASFVLMWLRPPIDQQVLLAIYYAAAFMLYDTFGTLVGGAYTSLTPELAATYDERTSLDSFRMAFSIAFGLVGAVAPLMLVDALAGPGASLAARREAYIGMAGILAAVCVPPLLIVFATTRERPEFQALPVPSLLSAFRMVIRNRAFMIAAGVYLLTWIPLDFVQFVLVFLIRDCFHLSGGERDIVFGLLFVIAAAALPLWVWVSGHWSKKVAYQAGIAFLAVVLTVLSLTSSTDVRIVFGLAALGGIGLSAAHAMPLAIVPDVIEWDELRYGVRREAVYYTVIGVIEKLVAAATIVLTGSVLAATGYVSTAGAPVAQPQAALNAIRLLSGPFPALFFFLGIALMAFFPISRERHARILRALERKRKRHPLGGDARSGG